MKFRVPGGLATSPSMRLRPCCDDGLLERSGGLIWLEPASCDSGGTGGGWVEELAFVVSTLTALGSP